MCMAPGTSSRHGAKHNGIEGEGGRVSAVSCRHRYDLDSMVSRDEPLVRMC